MGTAEKTREILADVLPRIAELGKESLAEIGAARAEASEKLRRHAAAVEELRETEGEISSLGAEREELPARTYQAAMDEDWSLEDDLKQRYKNLKPAIQALEERRSALRSELAVLAPRRRDPHRHDAALSLTAPVARAGHAEKEALEALRRELLRAVDAALEPVRSAYDLDRGQVEAWAQEKRWEQSPVGRGAVIG